MFDGLVFMFVCCGRARSALLLFFFIPSFTASLSFTDRCVDDTSCDWLLQEGKSLEKQTGNQSNNMIKKHDSVNNWTELLSVNKAAFGHLRPLSPSLGYKDAYTCPCLLSLPLASLLYTTRLEEAVEAEARRATLSRDRDTSTQAKTFNRAQWCTAECMWEASSIEGNWSCL